MTNATQTQTATDNCPQCGNALRLRRSRRGPFFGCSGYPTCRFTRDADDNGGERKRKHLPWSSLQEALFAAVLEDGGNLVCNAVAGSAKTTSSVEAAWRIKEARPDARILKVAFNKSIAIELGKKVPMGVEASTCHSAGLAIIRNAGGSVQIDSDKMEWVLNDIHPGGDYRLKTERRIAQKVIELSKGYLAGTVLDIEAICEHHDVEGVTPEIIDLAIKGMSACRSTKVVDFNDMIWLPYVLDLPAATYDFVFVDECQDLNRAQMELVRKLVGSTGRAIFVGDPRQAIYGFRGADSRAFERIKDEFNARELSLSVTYRCAKSIVRFAKSIVETIEPAPGAPEGQVNQNVPAEKMNDAAEGDLVLCRTNAPLVTHCLEMIRNGRKATIQGRDIGKQLESVLRRVTKGAGKSKARGKVWSSFGTVEMLELLEVYRQEESVKITAKGGSHAERRLQVLADKVDTIEALSSGTTTVREIVDRISAIFDDRNGAGIKFSSVHRAKGLEAETVWIIEPDKIPHPMAKLAWEREQEMNLLYVAITRAKRTLNVVEGTLAVEPSPLDGEDHVEVAN